MFPAYFHSALKISLMLKPGNPITPNVFNFLEKNIKIKDNAMDMVILILSRSIVTPDIFLGFK